MKSELRNRDRRALVGGGIILLPLLAWRLAAAPGVHLLEKTRQAVAVERNLLAHERTLLESAPDFAARADRLVRSLARAAPRVFRSDERPGLYVRKLADGRNVTLRGLRRGTAAPDSGGSPAPDRSLLVPVELQLSAESDLEGILSFIGALRDDSHLFVVDLVDLRAEAPASRQPEIVHVEMHLRAFLSGDDVGGRGS